MDNILVTVAIGTYNSSNSVIETLESIKQQTFQNIELIVSDDCSHDDTVEKCKEWIDNNNKRFSSVQLLTAPHNTGTAANCNRIFRASRGEWVKPLGADDTLLPTCIEDYVHYIQNHPEVNWVAAKMKHYREYFEDEFYEDYEDYYSRMKCYFEMDASSQFTEMLRVPFIGAPTQFMRRDMILNNGGYNEKYGILEDIPMHLKLLRLGYKCYFLDKYTVNYRMRGKESPYLFNMRLAEDNKLMTVDMRFPYFTKVEKRRYMAQYWVKRIISFLGLNRRSPKICEYIYLLLNKIANI